MAIWTLDVKGRQVRIETSDPGQPKQVTLTVSGEGVESVSVPLDLMSAQDLRAKLGLAVATATGGSTS